MENQTMPKGSVTLALLKANYDAGNDHIDMFVPFVHDAIVSLSRDDFATADIRQVVLGRSGLDIPNACLSTILTRMTRRALVRREGGRYFRVTHGAATPDLLSLRTPIEEEQRLLAQALRQFSAGKKGALHNDTEAMEVLLAFVSTNQVPLLFEQHPYRSLLPARSVTGRAARVVAAFIRDRCSDEHSSLRLPLQRLLEGMILHNALFLVDIGKTPRTFRNLRVYLDTRIVLQVLGLAERPVVKAAREAVQLLRDAQAKPAVFEVTLREIRGLLAVYESRLRTREGMLSLRPTQLTRYFVDRLASPADVKEIFYSLEQRVKDARLSIDPVPDHVAAHTLDEKALAEAIKRSGEEQDSQRVRHDVDCTAAILTMRRGQKTNLLDDAGAVFATSTGLLVRSVSQWYSSSGGQGVPPVVHVNAVSNLAWLKQPERWRHADMKLNELIASCYAALRPAEVVWDAFIKHLHRLETSGELTSEEAVAVAANGMTYDILADADDGSDIDAVTLSEVVERVRANMASGLQEQLALEKRRASESEEREAEIRNSVQASTEKIAKWLAEATFWIVAALIVVGLVISLFTTIGLNKWSGSGLAAVCIVSLLNLLYGSTVAGWKMGLRRSVEDRLRERFLGSHRRDVN